MGTALGSYGLDHREQAVSPIMAQRVKGREVAGTARKAADGDNPGSVIGLPGCIHQAVRLALGPSQKGEETASVGAVEGVDMEARKGSLLI